MEMSEKDLKELIDWNKKNQKIQDEIYFKNLYFIINLSDNRIEAFYESELNANFMLRNFTEYFPTKKFIVVNIGKQVDDRPTNLQLFRIFQIENECHIPFTGLTKEAASKFLTRHISKTKKFDEEYQKIKFMS